MIVETGNKWHSREKGKENNVEKKTWEEILKYIYLEVKGVRKEMSMH